MNIKNRQDFLVILTITAVGLFVAINFVFSPLQSWWSGRQKQISELREKVKDGSRLINSGESRRRGWKEMTSNALAPNPSEAELQFLKAMDGWSRTSGATITSIMPQWKIESTNYMTLDCRVETSGDLASLSKFIYNIERGPLMVRLDSVELSSHDSIGQQMTLGLQINGLALLQTDKK